MTDKKKPIKKRLNKMFDEIQYEEPDTEPRKTDEEIPGQDELESSETNAEVQEIITDEPETSASDLNTQEDENIAPTDISAESSTEDVETEETASADDLLEDVRRSLIEEGAKEEDKKPKWWKRFGKGGRKGKEPTAPVPVEEPDVESAPPGVSAEAELNEEPPEEYSEQIDELIDMLEPETEEVDEPVSVPPPSPPVQEKPEVVIDVEEMKRHAFQRTSEDKEEEDFSAVRAVALDDGEEVFVEVESKAEDQFEDRLKAFENALKPYRRYIYFGLTFIGVVALAIASLILYDAYQKSLPPETTQQGQAELLPYPVVMNLPGGLSFNLGKGTLQNGKWNPRGPEWLEGTEICRWIAIPWSRQLEAVVRTLTRDDSIELVMSNNDRIRYDVYSIEQLTIEEMQKRDSNSPCLMLVLAKADTDRRWVVTANP